MKISQFIKKLQEVQDMEGDLNVVLSEGHEYWGSVQRYAREDDVKATDHAQPDGPKSGKSERAVVLEYQEIMLDLKKADKIVTKLISKITKKDFMKWVSFDIKRAKKVVENAIITLFNKYFGKLTT